MSLNIKRIVSLVSALLIASSAVFLSGCSKNTKKILESTKEERTVVGHVNGSEVPMELYRYVALNYRSDYDHGDATVWTGDEGAALLGELQSAVDETVVGLYATLEAAKAHGVDIGDKNIDTALEARMEEIYASYERDYIRYKEDIAEYNMNDAVYRFLVRGEIVSAFLFDKLVDEGLLPERDPVIFDTVDYLPFARVKQILIASDNGKSDEENLKTIKKVEAKLEKGEDFEALLDEFGEDLFLFENDDGYYIAKGSYYKEFEDTAFTLAVGETSGIISTPAGYSILKRYPVEYDYVDSHFDELYTTFTDGLYNLIVEETAEGLKVEWNDAKDKYSIFNMK